MADTYASALRVFQAVGIDGQSVGNTKILTTENGTRTFYPTAAMFAVSALTGTVITPCTVSVGTNSPNYNNIMAATLVGTLNALNALLNNPIANTIVIAPNTDIMIRVSTAAIGPSSITLNCNLMAFYR